MLDHEFRENILPTMVDWKRRGIPFALATLVEIDGSSPRPLGSQMVVASTGKSIGQISGGCCENAIRAEAIDALENETNKLLRFGKDSPFIDIQLPCGSGITVKIDRFVPDYVIYELSENHSCRQSSTLLISLNLNEDIRLLTQSTEPRDDDFSKQYNAPIKLFVAGKGPIVSALKQQASLLEMDWELCTENGDFAEKIDQWSCVITLYHDHEKEDAYLIPSLKTNAFYIGSLGSQKTHQQRLFRLLDKGCDENDLKRIKGPVGIPIKSKSPPEIALSIMAEILQWRPQFQ